MTQLLSPQHVADILACRRGHVYKLIREGELSAIKFGPRMVRIEPEELERYKDSKCKTTTSGDLDAIEANGLPSEDEARADAALSSMKLKRKAQRALSGPSTLKRSA